MRPIYRNLAAAYGWTYAEIDQHTLAEASELFDGWNEEPPTHVLLQGLAKALLGAGSKSLPAAAQKVGISEADLSKLMTEAARIMPVARGVDKGLPKAAPVFDLEELRRRNAARIASAVTKEKASGR